MLRTSCDNEEFARDLPACLSLYSPFLGSFVKVTLDDRPLEMNVVVDTMGSRRMLEITTQLLVAGKSLAPGPVFPYLSDAELVE